MVLAIVNYLGVLSRIRQGKMVMLSLQTESAVERVAPDRPLSKILRTTKYQPLSFDGSICLTDNHVLSGLAAQLIEQSGAIKNDLFCINARFHFLSLQNQ
jgi:hypothetical protein